jgi:hypothetical protein
MAVREAGVGGGWWGCNPFGVESKKAILKLTPVVPVYTNTQKGLAEWPE